MFHTTKCRYIGFFVPGLYFSFVFKKGIKIVCVLLWFDKNLFNLPISELERKIFVNI